MGTMLLTMFVILDSVVVRNYLDYSKRFASGNSNNC